MRTIAEIFSLLQEKAPLEAKMDFDNVGLLAGLPEWETDKVLLSLDITDDVVSEAGALGAAMTGSGTAVFGSQPSPHVFPTEICQQSEPRRGKDCPPSVAEDRGDLHAYQSGCCGWRRE